MNKMKTNKIIRHCVILFKQKSENNKIEVYIENLIITIPIEYSIRIVMIKLMII